MARRKKYPRRKPKTGAIRHRAGRTLPWEAAFPVEGGHIFDAFATREEAAAHLDRLTSERDDRDRPRNIALGAQSLRVFLTDWLSIKESRIKEKTYQDYVYQCELAIGEFGDRRIDSITRREVDVFLAQLRRDGYQNVSQLRMVVAQAFAYAEEEDYIRGNVWKRASAPKVTRKPPIALSATLRAHLLRVAADTDEAAIWHLYSRLGLRRGEGIGLLWANVNWDKQTITITQHLIGIGGRTVPGTPKSARSRRTLPLPADIIDLLRAQQQRQRAQAAADKDWQLTGYVFTTAHGAPLTVGQIDTRWKRLKKRAGIAANVTIHGLRHTAIYLLESSGAPLSVVQAFAGHTAATMTAHYADHADLEAVRRALG